MEPFFTTLSEKDAQSLPALTLAYVGDAVHSLYVRQKLSLAGDHKIDALHTMASGKVKASAQAQFSESLLDNLTEAERAVYLRGRNSSTHHKAKNQSAADYRKATGFEAVLGYLYLSGQYERLNYILDLQQ